MCEYCGRETCTLTKEQAIAKGPILEINADYIMRPETEEYPQTYAFAGVPAFYSLSALIPDEDEENPHCYKRFWFDEDTGCDGDWEYEEIANPMKWQTEAEFLEKFFKEHSK